VECVWFWPTDKQDKASPAPHTHDYDEVIGFFGTDPNDLCDLGAEIEFYIDGERNVMNETPASVKVDSAMQAGRMHLK
jgi:hypothetical protein